MAIRLLFLILACNSWSLAQQTSVIVNHLPELQVVADAGIFVDSAGRKNVADLMHQPRLFTPSQEGVDFGRNHAVNWVRFTVHNTSAESLPFFIDIYYPRLERIRGYVLQSGKVMAFPLTGWGIPLEQRPFPHPRYVFPVRIEAKQNATVFLAVSANYQRIIVPITLQPYGSMLAKLQLATLTDGIVSCILFFVFIISLLYFADSAFTEWGNLWYGLYALSTFLFYFVRFDIQYFNHEIWNPKINYGVDGFVTLTLLFYCLSGYNFISGVALPNWFTQWYSRVITVLAILAIGLLVILINQTIQIALAARVLLAVVGISGLLYVLTKGVVARNPYALLFLLMFLPLLVFFAVLVNATDFSQSKSNTDAILIMKGIVCLETTLMMTGFIYKNNRVRYRIKKQLTEQQKQILVTQIQTQETERQRLAADLHDDLGGTLATIRRRLSDIRQRLRDPEAAHEMDALEPLIQKSGHDLRRIAHNLMPPEFERIGLRSALQQFVESQPANPTRFSFLISGTEQKLPLDTELNIYRIVSELVQNIHKHAQAKRAAVQMLYYEDHLSITVEDDGLGSRAVKIDNKEEGIGLKNSSLRAEYIGAKLWREASESGTLIVLDVPYPAISLPSLNP